MLQTLFFIPRQVFGLELFGFGLLLAIWLIGGGIVLLRQYRRLGWGPDVRGTLNVVLIAAVIVAFVLPMIGDSRGVPIQGYGTMLVVAVIAGTGLSAWRAWRMGVDPDVVISISSYSGYSSYGSQSGYSCYSTQGGYGSYSSHSGHGSYHFRNSSAVGSALTSPKVQLSGQQA